LLLCVAAVLVKDFRSTKIMLFAAALLILAGGLWRYRETVDVFFQRIHVQRYLHLPLVVTFWLLLAAIKSSTSWKKAAFVGVGLVVLVRNAPWYRVAPDFDYAWESYARRIDRGEMVEAPINPAGWVVRLEARQSE
jgi:hypothetical protein